MSSEINERTLKHLAKLARIELEPKEEEKLLKDLGSILNHFKELRELNTAKAELMAGGSSSKNVFREDGEHENTNKGAGVEAFPEREKGYLKIPPVFE